ncbi:hypothetical protein HAX54_039066 [Datura stramonium]|uniref:Uncharacterized protein n=1 Tax=Datura stramonium TaxID=4076 RepID=A0ABS8VNH7_DATST|nr:hypothetical protein [Datura stramonium]
MGEALPLRLKKKEVGLTLGRCGEGMTEEMEPKQAMKRGGKAKATKRSQLVDEQTDSGEEYQLPQIGASKKLKPALLPATSARVASAATPS